MMRMSENSIAATKTRANFVTDTGIDSESILATDPKRIKVANSQLFKLYSDTAGILYPYTPSTSPQFL